MKFKKYTNENLNNQFSKLITEDIDTPTIGQDEMYRIYAPVEYQINKGNYELARQMLDELKEDLDDFEESRKNKFFKLKTFISFQRKKIESLYELIEAGEHSKTNESLDDMDRRCEKCNTLLNDGGTCPKCDDGEEDYSDETEDMNEELSVREKLKAAYPELNFDSPMEEECIKEDISNREKLLRAYPELNFDKPKAFTDFDLNESIKGITKKSVKNVTESFDEDDYDEFDYDDDYDMDDVELDRRHAALYGGDRMYCDCGRKLVMDEWGGYCPDCNPKDPDDVYSDSL